MMKFCPLSFTSKILLALIFAVLASRAAMAGNIVLAPSDSGSANAFVYQFLPDFNLGTGPFADYLSAGDTADGANDGHDTKSLLQFDVSNAATGLTSGGQVASATLRLYAVSTAQTGFGADPTVDNPVTLGVNTLSGAWSAGDVTYGTLPGVTPDTYLTGTQNGINQWVDIDVTSEVQNWLNGTIANDGLLISQTNQVDIGGQPAIGVFLSTQGAQDNSLPGFAPQLVISTVPEPSMPALMLAGMVSAGCVLGIRQWRQRQV